MASRTSNLIRTLKQQSQQLTPIGSEIFIPNHSGDHSAGSVRETPTNTTDIANKAYVDTQIAGVVTGKLVQIAYGTTNIKGTTASVIGFDDTIPQITEGAQVISAEITPSNVNNMLLIDVFIPFIDSKVPVEIICALFQDSTANAIQASIISNNHENYFVNFFFRHIMIAGTTSATTFSLRLGTNNALKAIDWLANTAHNRYMGGVATISMVIQEIAV